jgi:predicted RNA-binding Zn-ribbon protein involved in translation (DUF1610 family)
MFKIFQVPEKLFSFVMWIVSLIFAGFLMGLGQLVIGDLPMATEPVRVESYISPAKLSVVKNESAALETKRETLNAKSESAELGRNAAQNEYNNAKEQFDNWIKTRQTTTDPAQDPEVIRRTRQLDALSANVRTAEKVGEGISEERFALDQAVSANQSQRSALEAGAQEAYNAALFKSDMSIFGLRLLVTLPLLLLGGWLVIKKRKSEYWPLMRGFVIFALYTFFFELVPYLPSYGGYIRYIVGIALTLIAGHYTIKWMRNYLATRAVVEKQAEIERKQSIRYEDALKKTAAGVCPGCERPISTTGDVLADYCVHCGMNLFDACKTCDTRKLSFYHFCMKCGTASAASPAEAPAST